MFVCPECAESRPDTGYCPNDGNQLLSDGGDGLIGSTIGQFKVSRLLGVGGMGRVYKGVNPTIASRVAIKVLSRDCADNPELVERFFAEARAVNVIRHENIVNVLDLAQLPDRRPYIVMEYLDGSPLSRTIASRGPLPLGSLARLTTEVLSALGAAHAQQIVHRDLKPDNIFITPQGRGKVLDFGIAKLKPEHSGRSGPTRDGSLMGTPHYMSPEQCQARPVDARTDLYAVGVILYEGATGRPPFSAEALFDLLKQHIEQPPQPPRSLRPDMPAEYETVILRALAKQPEQRWQTARELAGALTQAAQDLPQDQWAPLGTAEQPGVPSIRSMPTPGGGPPAMGFQPTDHGGTPAMAPVNAVTGPPAPGTPGQVAHATPVPLAYVGQPTPASSGQVQPRSDSEEGRGKKIAVVIGLVALLAGAGIGFAIYNSKKGGGDVAASSDDQEPSTDDQEPSTGDRAPTTDDEKPATDDRAPTTRERAPAGGADKPEAEAAGQNGGSSATTTGPIRVGESGGVTITGPVTIVKPGRQTMNTPNPKEFDVSGFIETATNSAKANFSDAILVRIDADGVYPSGKADLTLSDSFSVTYRFRSPSRDKRPEDLPQGVDYEPSCLFYVTVNKAEISSYVVEGFKCDYPEIGAPKCSAAQIWKKAIKKGAPAKNAVGSLGYWADSKGKGRWLFSIGNKHSNWHKDDC